MIKPLISVIIVTYNNEDVIAQCLNTLKIQSLKDYELIIVDNSSHDATINIIESLNMERVKLVSLQVNLGFTGGNIEGLKVAKGKYIALLNPDTEPSPSWLETLLKSIKEQKDIGLCASKLLVFGSELIDSAGDGCTVTGKGHKRGEGKNKRYFDQKEMVFGACGGAMLIKKELIDEIGFFDNDFFLIHEDTDFCFRAQLAGWKCLYVPEAVVNHKVRTSIGKMSDLAVYYSLRNARFVVIKNMPFSLILRYHHYYVIQEVLSFLFFVVKHKKFRPYFQAGFDFLKWVPALLDKRRQIQKLKKVKTREIHSLLTPIWDKDFLIQKFNKVFRQ